MAEFHDATGDAHDKPAENHHGAPIHNEDDTAQPDAMTTEASNGTDLPETRTTVRAVSRTLAVQKEYFSKKSRVNVTNPTNQMSNTPTPSAFPTGQGFL